VNPQQVSQSLNIIRSEFAAILDRGSATRVLQNARIQAQNNYDLYQSYVGRTHYTHNITEAGWGFNITRNDPLRFEQTTISKYSFRVDLTCEFFWVGNEFAKRNIAVRLWALNRQVFFREEWDAERIRAGALNERVMMRFHFDMAEPDQSAPLSHLQIGGIADANEYCWLHPKIEKPRFAHMPIDLVLACELIGATFYEQRYRKIRKSGLWKGEIRKSQQAHLQGYFQECLNAIASDRSVLTDCLWQRPAQA
jgi:hypothetical protein